MNFSEKLVKIAENVPKNVEYGKSQGGGGDGYYDLFWDGFQENGNRRNYNTAFKTGWTDEIFQPKYDIIVTSDGGAMMFQYTRITTLKSKMDELGLNFDTSQATALTQMFQGAYIKDVPIIDGSNATSLSYTFGSRAKIETIEKLILSNKLTTVSSAFLNAENLTHVIFEGELAITGLDLHWSTKLDAESYDSLMNILSASTTGMTVTLPPYATVKATYDAKYGDGSWDILAASKKNWTIAYS